MAVAVEWLWTIGADQLDQVELATLKAGVTIWYRNGKVDNVVRVHT